MWSGGIMVRLVNSHLKIVGFFVRRFSARESFQPRTSEVVTNTEEVRI